MGEIAKEWIILIVILGAAFSVLLGFALFRFFVKDNTDGIRDMSNEQKDYLRQVRVRNKGWNYFEARSDHYGKGYTESTVDA